MLCLPNRLHAQLVPISAEAHAKAAKRRIEAAVNTHGFRGIMDDMLRIEAVAPGFAGYYVEKDTVLIALLVDPENEARLRAATAELKGRREPGTFNSLSLTKVVRIVPAMYSLSELAAWQDLMFGVIAKFDVLTSVGVDITHNKVRIGITEAAGEPVMFEAVRKLGVPGDAVRIEVTGRIRTL
jgi:hypothetical protein